MAGKNSKNPREITAAVHGISYEVFAKVKWQQFLRGFSLAVAAFLLLLLFLMLTGRLSEEIPLALVLTILVVVLAILAIYRMAIRREYRSAGLAAMELLYVFDRDGWTVKQGTAQVRVLWKNTFRVRRNTNALLLYPNRKSVNLVPLKALDAERLERIIGWCRGEK